MKLTRYMAAAFLMCAAGFAHATCQNGATNFPTCTFPAQPSVAPGSVSDARAAALAAQQQQQQQAQQAAALARSGDSAASSTGVGVGVGAAAAGDSSARAGSQSGITDQSQTKVDGSRTYGLALALPQPIQLAAMAGVSCPTPDVKQETSYWGWGARASGSSTTNTDACVLINGYAMYLSMCQFGNANKLLGQLMASKLPGFQPDSTDMPNMNPEECLNFKNPRVMQASSVAVQKAAPEPLLAPVVNECRKGQLRSPGGRCYTPVKPVKKPVAVKQKCGEWKKYEVQSCTRLEK